MPPSRSPAIAVDARRVREQRLQQRRLADAVAADEHDLLAAVDDRVEVVDDLQRCRRPSTTPSNSSATLPDGRFIVNLMNGRWMFERARSVVCSRSTSLRRDVHLARARAGREARDEVVQLRDLLLALRVLATRSRERICVLAITMSS